MAAKDSAQGNDNNDVLHGKECDERRDGGGGSERGTTLYCQPAISTAQYSSMVIVVLGSNNAQLGGRHQGFGNARYAIQTPENVPKTPQTVEAGEGWGE